MATATPNNGSEEKPARFKIKKPWVTCLAENKKIWKEQAVKGKIEYFLQKCHLIFFSIDAEARAILAAEQAAKEAAEAAIEAPPEE